MKHALSDSWKSMLSLLRFLFWYGILVAAILYLLPWAGQLAQHQYEAMNSIARLFSVIGFFAVVGAWQLLATRFRSRRPRPDHRTRRPDFS